MSLFVRVQTSFWQHRKTMRLRALIGDAALWVPIRLWSYAAENQPDGDFTAYLPDELALLIGCSGITPSNACSIVEALQRAGFMDEMQIHDWKDHNGYHESYAERAKNAANVRWEREREKKKRRDEKKGQDMKGKEASIACSMDTKAKGTLEEVKAFAVELGLQPMDGESCFYKWEGNGWTNGGRAIKDWRATIRTWQHQKFHASQKLNGVHAAGEELHKKEGRFGF